MLEFLSRLANPTLYSIAAGVLALLGISGSFPDFLATNGDVVAGLFAAILAFLAAVGVRVERLKTQNRMLAAGYTPSDIQKIYQ
jgi:hypothetical protein